MGFARLHVGHKQPHLKKRDQGNACSNGGFTNPTLSQTIDSLQPLNISWDTTCLTNVQTIDIVLSAPGNNQPLLQGWKDVNFAAGYRVVDLLPRKWNDSASQQLQLSLYQSGIPSFLSPLPAGPVFTATYTTPSHGKVPAAADTSLEDGTAAAAANAKSSHGKIAAGVLIPLLLLIAGVVAYIRFQRRRGREKRKRWSEMVDKRMSTISTDWKSISAAGAQAAIRHSMAIGARDSSFSFGAIRPPSMAIEPTSPDMAQIRRPGTGLRNATLANAIASEERVSRVSFADTARVSRVSFAADPRPSTESRRTVGTIGSSRASRAFHSAYAPPVPSLPAVYTPKEKIQETLDDMDATLSPRQTAGPLTLSPDDIRARIQNSKVEKDDDDMADVMPALSMMRTGSANGPLSVDDYLLPPSAATIKMPEPTHYTDADVSSLVPSFPVPQTDYSAVGQSPTNLMMPLPSVDTTTIIQPTSPMTPDAMLRAYAERRAANMSPGPNRSNATSPFKRNSPVEMLRVYAERRVLNASPDPSRNAMSAGRRTPNSSPGGRLEKRPSIGGAIGGLAISLSKKGRKKDRESRLVTPVSVSKPVSVAGISIAYPGADNTDSEATPATRHTRTESIGVGAYGRAQYTIGEDDDEEHAYGGST
ncbi:hypothetical protein AX15_003731 [Amanita polypyramis BW_CC]|nr:hypothetical protein AX15_003731 [Amanita polypyramis BW_CC]